MANETITLRLVAQDLASGNITKAIGAIDKMAQRGGIAGSIFQGIGIQFGMMLNPVMLAGRAFGAVTDAIGDSVHAAADFEDAMTQSLAIMGDVSDVMRDDLEAAARDVAKTTTFSANQAAEAYYFLASAGMDAAAALKALPQVAQFAQAGNFDLAHATSLLTDAQSALGLTIRDDVVGNMENMARVSDVLSKAEILANASLEQFSESLTNKGAAALKLLGKEIEEGVAVLAAWAAQGVKGEEAGEKLAIVLRDLQTAAIKNGSVFDELGIAVFDSGGEMRDLADIIEDVEDAFEGLSDKERRAALMALGFQDRSIAATASLIGTSKEIRRYRDELDKAGGTTEEVAEKQLESFNAKMALLDSAVNDARISIGNELIPTLTDLAETLSQDIIPGTTEFLDLWTGAPDVFKTAGYFMSDWTEKNLPRLTEMAENYGVEIERVLDLAASKPGSLGFLRYSEGDATFFKSLEVYLQAAGSIGRVTTALQSLGKEAGNGGAAGEVDELKTALDMLNEEIDDFGDTQPMGKINKEIKEQRRLMNQAAREGRAAAWSRHKSLLFDAELERDKTRLAREAMKEWKRNKREEGDASDEASGSIRRHIATVQRLADKYNVEKRVVNAALKDNRGNIALTKKALEALGDTEATPTIDIDASQANTVMDALRLKLAALSSSTTYIDIVARGGRAGGGGGTGSLTQRAAGGPVSAGNTYLVGERGPELLHMGNQSGSITPNHKVGGTTIVIQGGTYLGTPEDARRWAAWVVPAIERERRRAGVA